MTPNTSAETAIIIPSKSASIERQFKLRNVDGLQIEAVRPFQLISSQLSYASCVAQLRHNLAGSLLS